MASIETLEETAGRDIHAAIPDDFRLESGQRLSSLRADYLARLADLAGRPGRPGSWSALPPLAAATLAALPRGVPPVAPITQPWHRWA